ncbi:MAG TPA: type IV pilus assembly protein PilM [Pirellulales bacterium]|jgi:type IV pilus assembly protein PilM
MARNEAVWGIDVGQCALKALRCKATDEPDKISVEAFDYIEYPKILSQPESDPVALVQEALKLFLSRNSVRGDKVAISVPGQAGLARFIKLPPVESKKIPDIVKYEAKQQIPFSLDDVVWDYQKMVGGSEEEGYALETEVGLFAIKRDQVFRTLRPFTEAAVEIDVVQLTPLALYNFVAFEQMQDLPPPADYNPDDPPPSVVVLSLGTDSTDLVVTNGYRVWQRSIPIGGNHFTKALTKELKLTFATAEHLKRNAAKAEDPKALFQAMRPIFNDLLTEVQRSISYFSNIDRRAKIKRVLALGNAMKLPGLQRYLAQNLGFEFSRIDTFRGLTGASVVDAPIFKDNVLSFGVCYGLALQGLKASTIKTNLLPRELLTDRIIRAKKPWTVGAAAALLLGCTISYFGYWRAWSSVRTDASYFGPAITQVDAETKKVGDFKSAYEGAQTTFKKTAAVSSSLAIPDDRRTRWLKVLSAINASLPRDPVGVAPPEKLADRNMINLMAIQSQRVDDLGVVYADIHDQFDKPDAPPPAPAAPAADAAANEDQAAAPAAEAAPAPVEAAPPAGPGWVVELRCHHYHNPPGSLNDGAQYVKNTMLKKLKEGKITLAGEAGSKPEEIDLKKLGVTHAVLLPPQGKNEFFVDPEYKLEKPRDSEKAGQAPAKAAPPGGIAAGNKGDVEFERAPRFDFLIQLFWADEPPKETAAAPTEDPDKPAAAPAAPAQPAADEVPEPTDEAKPEPGAPAAPATGEEPATEPDKTTPDGAPNNAPPETEPADSSPKPAAPDDIPANAPPATAPEGGAPPAAKP